MRVTWHIPFAIVAAAALLTPAPAAAAASKEMQDLSRDVGELSDQVKDFEKALDSKIADLQNQLQQQLDKTNTNVSSLNAGVTQTLQNELKGIKDQLNSVTSLSVKMDSESEDISDLKSQVSQLLVTVNKLTALVNDTLNQVKLIQAPPAAPPPAADNGSGAAPGTAAGPPPDPQTLFVAAVGDMQAGKGDLAFSEFAAFLHLYPNDPNAAKAQVNIGEIHYQAGKLDQAVKDFDTVIEVYPEDQEMTPEAYYMKGMALEKLHRPTDAIATYRALVAKFKNADDAAKAKIRLTAMGANVPPKKPAAK